VPIASIHDTGSVSQRDLSVGYRLATSFFRRNNRLSELPSTRPVPPRKVRWHGAINYGGEAMKFFLFIEQTLQGTSGIVSSQTHTNIEVTESNNFEELFYKLRGQYGPSTDADVLPYDETLNNDTRFEYIARWTFESDYFAEGIRQHGMWPRHIREEADNMRTRVYMFPLYNPELVPYEHQFPNDIGARIDDELMVWLRDTANT
jgi:hypothetical protein